MEMGEIYDAKTTHKLLYVLCEAVAYVSYRFDESMGSILNLTPEPSDMDIHGSIAAIVIVAPDTVEQRLPGEDAAAIAGQKFE